MQVVVEKLNVHRDSRGMVVEPLDGERLGTQRNVHVVFSQPGEIRGNHYHPRGTEVLVVQGPALVRLREDGRVCDYPVPDGEVHRFMIPPGVPHAVRHEGERQGFLVGFNSCPHDPRNPDTVREVLM